MGSLRGRVDYTLYFHMSNVLRKILWPMCIYILLPLRRECEFGILKGKNKTKKNKKNLSAVS